MGAAKLADWAVAATYDARQPAGFGGGIYGYDDKPGRQTWKSTEHNTDLAAVFDWLFRLQPEDRWRTNAQIARGFVAAQWDAASGHFWVGTTPDGDTFLALGSGKAKGKANKPRFDLPAFEALYEKQKTLPDGPERAALMLDAQRLLVAYAPYKFHVHRIWTDMAHPWVRGYSRNIFVRDYWKYVDIDPAAMPKAK